MRKLKAEVSQIAWYMKNTISLGKYNTDSGFRIRTDSIKHKIKIGLINPYTTKYHSLKWYFLMLNNENSLS